MIRDKIETERYTLYLGDCLNVLPTLQAGSADAVVTDPPYPEDARFIGSFQLIAESAKLTFAACKDKSLMFTDCFRPGLPQWLASIAPWEFYDLVTGFVVNSMANCAFGVDRFCPAIVARKGAGVPRQRYTNVIQITRTAGKDRHPHPTMKNIALIMVYVRMASREGNTILDPFMGSGTTGVACMKLSRRFIGIEIDDNYFKIAAKRIAKAAEEPPLFKIAREAEQGNLALGEPSI